jgi:hypothetical protein
MGDEDSYINDVINAIPGSTLKMRPVYYGEELTGTKMSIVLNDSVIVYAYSYSTLGAIYRLEIESKEWLISNNLLEIDEIGEYDVSKG